LIVSEQDNRSAEALRSVLVCRFRHAGTPMIART
jgi:hypothetical protein